MFIFLTQREAHVGFAKNEISLKFVHTADGCKILHHQKDGWNPVKIIGFCRPFSTGAVFWDDPSPCKAIKHVLLENPTLMIFQFATVDSWREKMERSINPLYEWWFPKDPKVGLPQLSSILAAGMFHVNHPAIGDPPSMETTKSVTPHRSSRTCVAVSANFSARL